MKASRHRTLLFGLSLFLLISCQPEGNQNNINEIKKEDTVAMLQHTVYFYLNEGTTQEEVEDFEEGLKELLSISEIHQSELGVPGKTEERDVTDHGFAYSIFTWFKTMEDYKIYAEHPDHLEFIDKYNHLWADVKVYDTEIISSE